MHVDIAGHSAKTNTVCLYEPLEINFEPLDNFLVQEVNLDFTVYNYRVVLTISLTHTRQGKSFT